MSDAGAGTSLDPRQLQSQLDEQMRLNAMLRDSVEQFMGAVIHDLKNPLAAIKINVQGLQRSLSRADPVEPERWAERLGRIEHAVEQVLHEMNSARTRTLAQADVAKPLRREPCDLVALVRELVEARQHAGSTRQLRVHSGPALLVGSWDEQRLRNALHQLLDNAMKFSPDGGEIAISVDREEGPEGPCALVKLRDQGIGIPARDLPHVFERFYRAENVIGRFKGAGLGLYEAHNEVSQHAGAILAESVEGLGSVFSLRLPLYS